MTLAVDLSEAAERDIRDAVDYIGVRSPAAAERFGADLKSFYRLIAESPDIGAALKRRKLRKLRLSGRFRKWLVFYRRVDTNTLQIARVLHGARNIRALLRGLK